MNNIHSLVKELPSLNLSLPFSVYSAYEEQKIQNVPIVKPLFIIILNGLKELGSQGEITCTSNTFIFLSNSASIDMRNIPNQDEYLAILIDFDYDDFKDLPKKNYNPVPYFQGELNSLLSNAISQFIEFSLIAPTSITKFRKKEILEILYHSGYIDICGMYRNIKLSEKVQTLVSENISSDLSVEFIASQLFMSSSTLRRKLKIEGFNIQDIKDKVKLGYGLHLIQTTDNSIGNIAYLCGYQSQSRFTEKFKSLFGMTPRVLRKTKMLN